MELLQLLLVEKICLGVNYNGKHAEKVVNKNNHGNIQRLCHN